MSAAPSRTTPNTLKPPSCSVFFGNLHSKVTERHLLELGTQVSPYRGYQHRHSNKNDTQLTCDCVQAGRVIRASRKDDAFGFVEYADVVRYGACEDDLQAACLAI